jgi:hypothetical protein
MLGTHKAWMTNPHPAASQEIPLISEADLVAFPRSRMGMASLGRSLEKVRNHHQIQRWRSMRIELEREAKWVDRRV